MKTVVKWTFWFDEQYPETDWPISDEEEQEYIDAIVREIRKRGYRITGFAHQGEQFCTPVFNDGRRYTASFRQWGGIMADAQGIEGEYGYAVWAWTPPFEGLNLPKPGDWEETVESLEQQGHRWQADQERQMKELRAEIESMDRLEGKYDNTPTDDNRQRYSG